MPPQVGVASTISSTKRGGWESHWTWDTITATFQSSRKVDHSPFAPTTVTVTAPELLVISTQASATTIEIWESQYWGVLTGKPRDGTLFVELILPPSTSAPSKTTSRKVHSTLSTPASRTRTTRGNPTSGKSSGSSTNSEPLALEVGIPVATFAFLAIVLGFVWYNYWRKSKRQTARESTHNSSPFDEIENKENEQVAELAGERGVELPGKEIESLEGRAELPDMKAEPPAEKT